MKRDTALVLDNIHNNALILFGKTQLHEHNLLRMCILRCFTPGPVSNGMGDILSIRVALAPLTTQVN